MVRKFLDWHRANPRELLATEQALKVQVGRVEITGRVDRLEKDGQDRGVIVDLKTGGSAPHDEDLDRHPQLGVYQLAVLLGAFEPSTGPGSTPAAVPVPWRPAAR
jgi:RecB family exonuclease